MTINKRVSSGIGGVDQAIDMLRIGDNVVWQVQSIADYLWVVRPYIEQAVEDGRKIIYFRFGNHEPLLEENPRFIRYNMDASVGFESFATKIHDIIEQEGFEAFYVFDCLSDLLEFWYSDLMIGNFFRVTCPFLYQLDTIAYFALIRGQHTHSTIARIRETTQLLLDIYHIDEKFYVHPLKAWERYSPTMFFPHLIDGDKGVPITSSADAAALFSGLGQGRRARDYWEIILERANDAIVEGDDESRENLKNLLISLTISKEPRITELARQYFSLQDILDITSREIGTGFVGGKSVGMLLGRKVLQKDVAVFGIEELVQNSWEPHDSWFLGSDIFYTYIVQNGWWELRCKQKTDDGYFSLAPELQEKLLSGKFPDIIREQFFQMMEYFGQSPIIVRSSSLLEDNFGNAFAGKYESVFCANQGSPDERFRAFEQAVRSVYASAMNNDALAYRKSRGLSGNDEQMAILVQRVSGDHYAELFFPHIAGVGHSCNLYVWNKDMDHNAGMLRLVFGLGTRAVDRVCGDYARLVPLDNPQKRPPVIYGEEWKICQRNADVLNLRENKMTEVSVDFITNLDLKTEKRMFFSQDVAMISYFEERGLPVPPLLDFRKLLAQTKFPELMKKILSTIEKAYNYPVDIEFTANFNQDGNFKFNLLQCRPLQTKGMGKAVNIPKGKPEATFFSATGNFMGGNVRLMMDYVIFVKAEEYLALDVQNKYAVARLIGMLNEKLKGENIMLIGPGRWGTTTPSLGVPVQFGELSNMSALCEFSHKQGGLMPELSFGCHFFQDIVESDIFYVAIFDGDKNVVFNPSQVLDKENMLSELLPSQSELSKVVQVSKTNGLTLYSDVRNQEVLCGRF